MTCTKILLANYPKMNQSVTFEKVGESVQVDIISGYDLQVDNYEVTLGIARDLIIALLTYDEVYLMGNNVTDVVQVWGMNYLKELLRLRLVKLIPDVGLNPVLSREKGGIWHHDYFGYANGCNNLDTGEQVRYEGPFGHVENWLLKKDVTEVDRNALIYLLEDNAADTDIEDLKTKALAETSRDLTSLDFLTDREFYRIKDGKAEFNTISELRLHTLNTLSVVAATLRMDSMKTDGAISQLLVKKTRSVLSRPLPDGVNALTCITQEKGFPDLGELFVNQIIDLEDVLKLRNSFQGRMFRYWAKHDEYEERLMRQDIMNIVQSSLGSKISTAMRMIACNLVGLAGFLPGLLASATDSFIINEIAKGWHPNMFLDNKLKSLLDAKIAEQRESYRREKLAARFKGVQRNDPCPCGSGKKFKHCHGR